MKVRNGTDISVHVVLYVVQNFRNLQPGGVTPVPGAFPGHIYTSGVPQRLFSGFMHMSEFILPPVCWDK